MLGYSMGLHLSPPLRLALSFSLLAELSCGVTAAVPSSVSALT